MNRFALATAAASSLLLSACGGYRSWLDVLPDDRLQLELSADGAAKAVGGGEWSEFYLLTHGVTEDVNGAIGLVLGTVYAVTHWDRPSSVDYETNTATWGPYSDALDPTETTLWVHQDDATGRTTWGVDQWPKGSPDGLVTVIYGEVHAGGTAEASAGTFTVDLASMAVLDPTDGANAVVSVDYAIRPTGASARVLIEDLATDAAALYVFDQERGSTGQMDLRLEGDLDVTSPALEVLEVRSRWEQTGAGRSDARASGGDLVETGTVSECWDTTFQAVYRVESWSDVNFGDPNLCSFGDVSMPDEGSLDVTL